MNTATNKATEIETRANEIEARLEDALACGPLHREAALRVVRSSFDASITDAELEAARVRIGATLGSQMIWPAA
jgi:hypothetical protein